MISSVITSFEPVLHQSMQHRFLYKKQAIKLLLAFLALALGLMIYLLDRPANTILFLQWLPYHINNSFSLGIPGDNLPSFAHTYAFTLIISAAITIKARTVALSWLAIECFFELIQSSFISTHMSIYANSDSSLLVLVSNYCVNGTFDGLDIVAITLGSLLAYFTINKLDKTSHRKIIDQV